eukprot:gene6256-biopygen20844
MVLFFVPNGWRGKDRGYPAAPAEEVHGHIAKGIRGLSVSHPTGRRRVTGPRQQLFDVQICAFLNVHFFVGVSQLGDWQMPGVAEPFQAHEVERVGEKYAIRARPPKVDVSLY